jgi:uncharacterized repeat protein (TIGR03803 family)
VRTFAQSALTISLAALLVGCGGSPPPIGAPGAMPQSSAMAPSSYKVLYSFTGRPDGEAPSARLIDVNGTLYGTTYFGGANKCFSSCGAVFSITKAGKENVLYSFRGQPDGANPEASLIAVNGRLYGTTYYGGTYRRGTVLSVSTSGNERVLHSFGYNGSDGVTPWAGLISVRGTLYGTTIAGGAYRASGGGGTVFSISTSGTENVLHSFGGAQDGKIPKASLIDVKGTLYGTTAGGGVHQCYYESISDEGCGTVFSITKAGKERVLYSFDGAQGNGPLGGLIAVNDTLYGTTNAGGTYSHYGSGGGGTAFSIDTSGSENVLHSFGEGSDGLGPWASLINVNGTLYGTTMSGGQYGLGTVFSITTGGTEKVLHSFGSGSDGSYPAAGLINVNGALYGTTVGGGTYSRGTVFALTP